MKTTILISVIYTIILTSSGCEPEPEPEPESQVGTLHLTVRYQTNKADSIPDVGSYGLLFDEDAHSRDYWEAKQGFAQLDGKTVIREFSRKADENGKMQFTSLIAKKYYLVVISASRGKYTEKIIEIPRGDTLYLTKDFTNAAHYREELEPWDYVIPIL